MAVLTRNASFCNYTTALQFSEPCIELRGIVERAAIVHLFGVFGVCCLAESLRGGAEGSGKTTSLATNPTTVQGMVSQSVNFIRAVLFHFTHQQFRLR